MTSLFLRSASALSTKGDTKLIKDVISLKPTLAMRFMPPWTQSSRYRRQLDGHMDV